MTYASVSRAALGFASFVLVACSSGGTSSSSSSGQGASGGGSSSGGDKGTPSTSDGGTTERDGGGAACPGVVVSTIDACRAPCAYNELIDSSNGPGPLGGNLWCASTCARDADCVHPGEICDARGPTSPHLCVRACESAAACQKLGLPECSPLNDGRTACF